MLPIWVLLSPVQRKTKELKVAEDNLKGQEGRMGVGGASSFTAHTLDVINKENTNDINQAWMMGVNSGPSSPSSDAGDDDEALWLYRLEPSNRAVHKTVRQFYLHNLWV